MIRSPKPWAFAPFEVLMHAEMHYREGQDFDRRIAMIGFDNAIETAITTYLGLDPLHRSGQSYSRADCDQWLKNYHTKIEFYVFECGRRGVDIVATKEDIVWYHGIRNDQYHGGGPAIPQRRELDGVRAAAIGIYGLLFDDDNVDATLDEQIADFLPAPPPPRSKENDKVIDARHDLIEVCGQLEYASEVLYQVDPERYRELAIELADSSDVKVEDDE